MKIFVKLQVFKSTVVAIILDNYDDGSTIKITVRGLFELFRTWTNNKNHLLKI